MKNRLFTGALLLFATLAASCSDDKEEGGSPIKLNPDPTRLTNITLMKATFATDEFNMISEPGFELYPDEDIDYRSLWYFEGAHKEPSLVSKHDRSHGGQVALKLDNPNDGAWCDACLQSIALKKGKDYTYTCFGQASWAGMNAFTGVRLEGGPIHDGQVSDWVPEVWTEFAKEFNSGDFTQGNVFCGAWGFPGVWVALDDFRLIPTGTTQTSTRLNTCSSLGEVSNASFTEISFAGKAVIWAGPDNTVSMALADVLAGGKSYANAFVSSNDTNPDDGFYIAQVSPGNSDITPLIEPSGDGEIACIPTAGVTVGGKQYIHYYSLNSMDPDDEESWTANFSGLLSSADGGKTWTREIRGRWSGAGHFVQAAFCLTDRYLYMFGSDAGRSTPKIYVARIKSDGDIATASDWTYWDGNEWVAGDPESAAAITFGNASEMCVTYNAAHKRYIMAYRSPTTGGLFYRDAGTPEGDWSGEKVLLLDSPGEGEWYSPSVYPYASGDAMYFIVSKL